MKKQSELCLFFLHIDEFNMSSPGLHISAVVLNDLVYEHKFVNFM